MSLTKNKWLRCEREQDEAGIRLVCFPHAGGSAVFFRDWAAELPGVEVHAVRYPGRAERMADELATDLVAMAQEIADAIAPLADRPIALFGHSMGAAVALETARALESAGVPVAHLFASGSRNAPLPVHRDQFSEDPADLAAQLGRLGGTDAAVLEDPDFLELVMPYVLGDGRLFHSYEMAPQPLLACPVTTIVGTEDDDADLRPWPDLTAGGFAEHPVPGDHFYLVESPPREIVLHALGITVPDHEEQS